MSNHPCLSNKLVGTLKNTVNAYSKVESLRTSNKDNNNPSNDFNAFAFRKSCDVTGTGLSHYILVDDQMVAANLSL